MSPSRFDLGRRTKEWEEQLRRQGTDRYVSNSVFVSYRRSVELTCGRETPSQPLETESTSKRELLQELSRSNTSLQSSRVSSLSSSEQLTRLLAPRGTGLTFCAFVRKSKLRGEIVSETGPGFLTANYGATKEDDMRHWRRFPPFTRNRLEQQMNGPNLNLRGASKKPYLFMRWKERFVLPEHKVDAIHGASFAGLYYICESRLESRRVFGKLIPLLVL